MLEEKKTSDESNALDNREEFFVSCVCILCVFNNNYPYNNS